jgi:hypothetical protein
MRSRGVRGGTRWLIWGVGQVGYVFVCSVGSLMVFQGQATLEVAERFKNVVGCDPSPGMVENARLAVGQLDMARRPTFEVSPAEDLSFLGTESVDMAIAGAHHTLCLFWFL